MKIRTLQRCGCRFSRRPPRYVPTLRGPRSAGPRRRRRANFWGAQTPTLPPHGRRPRGPSGAFGRPSLGEFDPGLRRPVPPPQPYCGCPSHDGCRRRSNRCVVVWVHSYKVWSCPCTSPALSSTSGTDPQLLVPPAVALETGCAHALLGELAALQALAVPATPSKILLQLQPPAMSPPRLLRSLLPNVGWLSLSRELQHEHSTSATSTSALTRKWIR